MLKSNILDKPIDLGENFLLFLPYFVTLFVVYHMSFTFFYKNYDNNNNL